MKKLKLDDFAKANVIIEKKAMMSVKGGETTKKELSFENAFIVF